MYIKNPNKKVSYSFRINPETLEELKLYAKATNKSVPQLLNILIEDKLEGVTLTNDYLNRMEPQIITVPSLEELYDNTDLVKYIETIDQQITVPSSEQLYDNSNLVKYIETIDLLNPFGNGSNYQVNKIPNNLDIWDSTDVLLNNHGYTSRNYPKYLHEGIEVYLAPELIPYDFLLKNDIPNSILKLLLCLLYIHYGVTYEGLEITLLTPEEALSKAKEINNFNLMDTLGMYILEIQITIQNVLYNMPKEPNKEGNYSGKGSTWTSKDEMLKDYNIILIEKLEKLAGKINTGNIVTKEAGGNETPVKTVENSEAPEYNNLKKENEELKKRVTMLENNFKEIYEILYSENNEKARQKVWDSISKQ